MENNKNSGSRPKPGWIRKVMTILIVLLIFAALLLAARFFVGNIDVTELLRKIHGG